jgi:hypothetical protein
MRVESSQSFARRVAVVVVSDRYHGPLGTQRVEPFISGTAAAAVMTHLQEVDLTGQTSHRLFRGKPGIARKQYLEVTVLDEEHQRVLIQVFTPACPIPIGMKDAEVHTIQDKVLSPMSRVPGNVFGGEILEKAVIERIRHLLSRLDDQPGRQLL